MPIRRLPLEVGDSAEMPIVVVDVETLALDVVTRRYERVGERRWRHVDPSASIEFDVDEYGLAVDQPDRFRRHP